MTVCSLLDFGLHFYELGNEFVRRFIGFGGDSEFNPLDFDGDL